MNVCVSYRKSCCWQEEDTKANYAADIFLGSFSHLFKHGIQKKSGIVIAVLEYCCILFAATTLNIAKKSNQMCPKAILFRYPRINSLTCQSVAF